MKKMHKMNRLSALAAAVLAAVSISASAGDKTPDQTLKPAESVAKKPVEQPKPAPVVAVLPFEQRDGENKLEKGKSIAELVGIGLMEAECVMVERTELNKVMDELSLSSVGAVDKDSQVKLGRLTGANILITGSSFRSGDKNFLAAKIIGTETSRVLGASVNGKADPADLVPELSKKIADLLKNRADSLMPKDVSPKDAVSVLEKTVQGNHRKVFVEVKETIRENVPDPAAQTALENLLLALGFDLTDQRAGADFVITGEAFAENAGAFHRFTAAAARVELKITADKEKRVLASGARKDCTAGPVYAVTAKDALESAALRLAVELFPVLK